jgi:hypothetical protein
MTIKYRERIPPTAKLFPTKTVALRGNPRRMGSYGHKSLGIIIKNPGIELATFRKKGGRPEDLRWDLDHGYARTR